MENICSIESSFDGDSSTVSGPAARNPGSWLWQAALVASEPTSTLIEISRYQVWVVEKSAVRKKDVGSGASRCDWLVVLAL